MSSAPPDTPALSSEIESLLSSLVASARDAFREDLVSIVLFGSGAEGRLRTTSDLNLLIVLRRFEQAGVDAFREPWRLACLAARATAMFVLEEELVTAADAFAVKFDDIARRRRVLFGPDPITGIATTRTARIQRLRQVLLNFTLRLRERYASLSLREEQLAAVIANAAGPLRSAAATLLELEGRPAGSPREALQEFLASLPGDGLPQILEWISVVRNTGALPSGVASPSVFGLIDIAEAMQRRLNQLG